jgi:hypothetical protein
MVRRRTLKILLPILIVLVAGGGTIAGLYTDLLFFQDLGYGAVLVKILSVRLLTGLAVGMATFVFMIGNLLLANRITFPQLDLTFINQIRIPMNIGGLGKTVKVLGAIAALAISVMAGIWGNSLWTEVLLFWNRMNVGLADPILGYDVSYYLFQLPLLQSLQGYAGFIIFTTFVLVGANYFFRGGVLPTGNTLVIDHRARKHAALLGGLFLLNWAFGFYLDQFDLLTGKHGVIYGAGYTDVYARLMALRVLLGLTVVTALVFSAGVWMGRLKVALVPAGVTVIVYVAGFMAYPALLQNLKVSPNELDLERPFIEHHIGFTRFAYDLERIEMRPFDPGYTLTAGDIEKNDATVKNIRLWDDAPLLKTYSQLQQIRTYYKLTDVDSDRYIIDSEYRQVMLSARELSYADLPSRSWINEKMVFTHGNGVTLGPVNRITREGLPEFFIKDIPPASSTNIKITRPEIYFGELSSDYVIVKTKAREFSYPTADGNVYTSYNGTKGVLLDSMLKKTAFAMKFNSGKILLSTDITGESRILYKRAVRERVHTLAPFLIFDQDPYIVVSDEGKLFWILDAYTVSNRVPYSRPANRDMNYIRNSIKATVDAYDGSVNFYVTDPADIIAKVYGAIFPGLFKPLSAMPEDVKKHIRYPQELFAIQASMFATYHMKDPKVFYNKEDLWEVPATGEKLMEPYYTIMKLPEEKKAKGGKEEYVLLLPFTPAKRDNLAAWLAAQCDWPHYGKVVVYSFPRDRLVFGPRQVAARIDQDANISQMLTLWGQKGSRVIRGRLLVIPIETSLLYVQPLYLVASDAGGLPELRRVIVAYGNDVVMEDTLEAGLQRLFGQRKGVSAKEGAKPVANVELSSVQLAKEAAKLFDKANELLRQGDWAGYGEQVKKLGEVLKKLAK